MGQPEGRRYAGNQQPELQTPTKGSVGPPLFSPGTNPPARSSSGCPQPALWPVTTDSRAVRLLAYKRAPKPTEDISASVCVDRGPAKINNFSRIVSGIETRTKPRVQPCISRAPKTTTKWIYPPVYR